MIIENKWYREQILEEDEEDNMKIREERISMMENLITEISMGGEYVAQRGRIYIYICKNNGCFSWSRRDSMLPGYASFIGRFTVKEAQDWLAFQKGEF